MTAIIERHTTNTLVPSDEAPLFRALLVHHRAGDRLILNLHHIAGDGIGTVRFLRSVQRAYAGEEDPPPLIDLMPARDLEQLLGIADLDERKRREEPRRRYLEELARDVPTRLVPEGAEPSAGQGIVNLRLTSEEGDIIRRRRRPGTTLNDVLVTAHQLAYQEWNRRHGAEPGRIGTMMAMNSRPKEWRHDVLSNYALPGIITTRPAERATFDSTLRAVAAWTTAYKCTQGGAIAAELEAMGREPVGMKRSIAAGFPDTFWEGVLSNLCRLDELGDFGSSGGRVAELWFTPPVVVQGIAMGAAALGDRIFIAGRYRLPVLGTESARSFMALYREMLLFEP